MRKRYTTKPYSLPFVGGDDMAANLAHFLLANAGSVWGKWKGQMKAADQRALFGRFIGKGLLVIDGNTETIKMYVRVCFGTDFDCTANIAWRAL